MKREWSIRTKIAYALGCVVVDACKLLEALRFMPRGFTLRVVSEAVEKSRNARA